MNIYPFLFILLTFLASCSNDEAHFCTDSHDAIVTEVIVNEPTDSIPKSQYPQDLNRMGDNLDSLKNPYIVQTESVEPISCKNESSEIERIRCVISQFQKASLPIHAGPTHDIPRLNKRGLTDRTFITKCLNDSNYFKEEERMYAYLNGKMIDSSGNYYLVLVAEEFSVGKDFQLLTISKKNGERIDHAVLGSESSDVESIYGKVTDTKHFETDRKKFGYDEENDLLFFETEITRHFEITEEGYFSAIEHKGN